MLGPLAVCVVAGMLADKGPVRIFFSLLSPAFFAGVWLFVLDKVRESPSLFGN